jgi:hypothetical protein
MFAGRFCNWSSGDDGYAVMVTAHPSGWTAMLGLLGGQKGERSRTSSCREPPAAASTPSYAQTYRNASDLYAVYPQGVDQVSFEYAKNLPVAKIIAVMRFLTCT